MDKWFIAQGLSGHTEVFTAKDHFSAYMKAGKRFGGVAQLVNAPQLATEEQIREIASRRALSAGDSVNGRCE